MPSSYYSCSLQALTNKNFDKFVFHFVKETLLITEISIIYYLTNERHFHTLENLYWKHIRSTKVPNGSKLASDLINRIDDVLDIIDNTDYQDLLGGIKAHV